MMMFGAERTYPQPTFALMVRGEKVAELDGDELTRLAVGLAFRLNITDPEVVHGPTGVELNFGDEGHLHLCHSDEAETFARQVMSASGLDEAVRA